MESKIPLPTDNIYKFYALFGVLLLVTAIAAYTYVHQTTNTFLSDSYVTVWELEAKSDLPPNEVKKKELIEKRIEIAIKDRQSYNGGLLIIFLSSLGLLSLGFFKWHKEIQPKQDRLLDLQIQKAELELEQLKRATDETP